MKNLILILAMLFVFYGNVLAEEYFMKSIGKNNFKSMIINNEKLSF